MATPARTTTAGKYTVNYDSGGKVLSKTLNTAPVQQAQTPQPIQTSMPVSQDAANRGIVGYGQGGGAIYAQGNAPANVIPTAPSKTPASTVTISNKNKQQQIPGLINQLDQYSQRGMTSDGENLRYADGTLKMQDQAPETDIGDAARNTPEWALLEQMRSSLDANTASQIAGIQQQLEQRRQETNQFSQNQARAAERSRLMSGQSQSAPTSVGSLLNAQESYRVKQIAALDVEEQRLIAAAKAAQESGKYDILARQIALISGIREKKQQEVAEANKLIAKQNEKIQEQIYQASRDNAVADLYEQGITNPTEMLKALNESGGDFTLKEIKDTIGSLVPEGLNNMIENARNNGASPELISKAMKSNDINEAYKILGSAAAKAGTGIVSEYQFYARDAQNRGLVPVDFNTYQNMDANRKKSIARAGASGGGGGSTGGFTPSTGKGASSVTDSLFNIVRVNANSATLPILESSYRNAKTTGEKLDVIAVAAKIPAAQKQDITAVKNALNNVDRAIAELDKGAKTGFINSKAQYGANVFGKDYDPALQKVGAYITAAVQPYRNEVTGAAWGGQEDAEYQSLFGSTKYSPTELKNRLLTMKEVLAGKAANTISTNIAPAGDYSQMFSQVFANLPNPTPQMNAQATGQLVNQSNDQAKSKVFNYVTSNPSVKNSVRDMINDGQSYITIMQVLGIN